MTRLGTVFGKCSFFFFIFQLLSPGVTTADHLPPCHPMPSTLLCHTNPPRVLLHYINKSPLSSSSFPAPCQLHLLQPLSSLSTNPPLQMSKSYMKAINKSVECSILRSNKVNKVTKQKSVFRLYQIFLKNSYRVVAPRKNITHVIDGADVCGCAVWVRKGR